MPEVELGFAGAWDFGGAVGTRIFLRCTDITLPEEKDEASSLVE